MGFITGLATGFPEGSEIILGLICRTGEGLGLETEGSCISLGEGPLKPGFGELGFFKF